MAPRLAVFALGTPDGGGSGFQRLVGASRADILHAEIVGVVSGYANGGVAKKAFNLGIPFIHFPSRAHATEYWMIANDLDADFVALSGWLQFVRGLDPRTTINIHPGPLPRFGGKGMHGDHVHEAVLAAYHRGEISHSAVTMHFVTEGGYDQGPVFFEKIVPIEPDDTMESLRARVNAEEHRWQARITNDVLAGRIRWDGKDPKSLVGRRIEP